VLAAFAHRVRARPSDTAIAYFAATISFRELDEMTDALAAALVERGVRRGDRVGAYLQNVPQFALALIAAWKAGAALVAINPMLRHSELRTVLGDSGATILVTLESLWADVARDVVADTPVSHTITTSELDFAGEEVPEQLRGSARRPDPATEDLLELIAAHQGAPAPVDPLLGPDDPAFLTYTSGTTGPAKGAINTHGNVLFASQAYRDWVGLDDDDVILGIAPLFHITGLVAHLGLGMVAGLPIVLAHRFDPDHVLELIEHHRATFTVASITAYIALMNAESAGRRDVSSLRLPLSGGAAISPAVVGAWRDMFGSTIVPVYGLTETTGPTHMVPPETTPPVDPASGALAVGVPVFGTTAWVVDELGRELPPGEPGELLISGPQVVPAYWEKPEESAETFAGGAMRTGDIAVVDSSGWFYIVDRKKDLINASGYKVWPREVEDVLLEHPAVREAAVIGIPDPYRGETVKAFVSLRPGEQITTDELTAFCRERMAAYKYPRSIELRDELPKGASGKILRRELRPTPDPPLGG
jgi:long-chain acyl-CoA synthetase